MIGQHSSPHRPPMSLTTKLTLHSAVCMSKNGVTLLHTHHSLSIAANNTTEQFTSILLITCCIWGGGGGGVMMPACVESTIGIHVHVRSITLCQMSCQFGKILLPFVKDNNKYYGFMLEGAMLMMSLCTLYPPC